MIIKNLGDKSFFFFPFLIVIIPTPIAIAIISSSSSSSSEASYWVPHMQVARHADKVHEETATSNSSDYKVVPLLAGLVGFLFCSFFLLV